MPLDQNAVQGALNAKGAGGICPSCGQNDWGVSGMPVLLTPVDPDSNSVLMGQGVKCIFVGCNNCGLVRLHIADVLGV